MMRVLALASVLAGGLVSFGGHAYGVENVGVRLAEQSDGGTDSYPIYLGVAAGVSSMVVCENGQIVTCSKATAGAMGATFYRSAGELKIFKSDRAMTIKAGVTYAIVGFDAQGARIAQQALRFEQPSAGGNGGTTNPGGTNPGGSGIAGDRVKLQDMSFKMPDGFKLHQDAKARGMLVLGLTNGSDYLRVYVRSGDTLNMQSTFVNGTTVTKPEASAQVGTYTWKTIGTEKKGSGSTRQVSAFSTTKNGYTYYGYATSTSSGTAAQVVDAFLKSAE